MIRLYETAVRPLDWFNEFSWLHINQNGQWVDTDRYDIVEKPEYRQRLIENKETEIKKLEQLHQERKDRLLKELDELKNKRELGT